ncbi:hypothetical protein [Caproicibacterium amylolyticum]|uniref:Uncharacterized protein n=1 Tax=Caproicibacterium amylolyticum TaxID=2766537 RepID=A0A7G9WF87_9FIRM|nr:hypothetical protein [Caproicibacterium amylolyticum]QNO17349.1 hypothetical protein H6X83_10395 [Caproicibacterium amylolyticum]
MLKFTEEDRSFIQKYFDNAKALLNAENLNDVLDPLYDLIDVKGFAPPNYEEYNDFGRKAQKIYDSIYSNN